MKWLFTSKDLHRGGDGRGGTVPKHLDADLPWQPWTDFRKSIEKVLQYHREHPRKLKALEDLTGMDQTIDNVRPSTVSVDGPGEA